MTSALASLLSLVLPRDCAGCGRADRVLCRRCRAVLGPPWRCEEDATFLAPLPGVDQEAAAGASSSSGVGRTGSAGTWPVWTLAEYRGPARHAVLAWKSGARPDLAPVLRDAAAAAVPAVLEELVGDGALPGPDDPGALALAVVPAPSGRRRRFSGRFVVGELADAVGGALARAAPGREVLVLDVLSARGGSGHRLGVAARGRRSRVGVRTALPPGLPCLLVDDVVTTGATLVGCRDALRVAGARPVGALTLAATPPPGAATRAAAPPSER